jgi:hypothetical protein
MHRKGNTFGRAIDRVERLRSHAQQLNQSWIRSQGLCTRMFA